MSTSNGTHDRLTTFAERAARGEPLHQDGDPAPTQPTREGCHQTRRRKPDAERAATPANSAPSRQLSPMEADIVEALGSETVIGKKLAPRAGYPYDGGFRAILANLVKCGVLEATREGYRVGTGSPADSAGPKRVPTSLYELLAGLPPEPLHVSIRTPQVSITLDVKPEGGAPSLPPSGLSPIERQVYESLTDEHRVAKAVAGLARRSLSYVRAALRSLRDKGLAEFRHPAGWRRAGDKTT